MKSVLYHQYEPNSNQVDSCNDIECFLSSIKYEVGSNILLVGEVGTFGKRLRLLGVNVTILENTLYQDICYSLVHNENCSVIKGSLEFLPFEDNYFDKIIILDHFNHITDCKKASLEISRVLRPKGELVLEDLNLKNIKVKLKYFKHKICGEHVNYHYPQEIFNIFLKLDFDGALKEVENERYIYIGKQK